MCAVDAGDLAVLDERGDHRQVVAAFVRTGKQGVFSIQNEWADGTFDGIAAEVDTAIIEES